MEYSHLIVICITLIVIVHTYCDRNEGEVVILKEELEKAQQRIEYLEKKIETKGEDIFG